MKQLYIDTLTPEQIKQLEEQLKPGRSSQQGFLGEHERLTDVIREDAATLERLGVTHEELADRLEYVVDNNDPKYHVHAQTWRGCQ